MTTERSQSGFALNPQDELNDLRMSDKALPLFNQVKQFIQEVVQPASEKFHELGENRADIWDYAPGQLEVLDAAKQKAKAEGLWNFFLLRPARIVRTGRRAFSWTVDAAGPTGPQASRDDPEQGHQHQGKGASGAACRRHRAARLYLRRPGVAPVSRRSVGTGETLVIPRLTRRSGQPKCAACPGLAPGLPLGRSSSAG